MKKKIMIGLVIAICVAVCFWILGNVIYYDAGLTTVTDHKRGEKYTENLKKPYGRPHMKNTLYTIIRLKN